MESVLTPEQMRAADEAAIAAGTPSAVLMERAAHACAVVTLRMLGGAYGKRVVVVAGKGNNGGDGVICGRILAARGVHATVFRTQEWSQESFAAAVRRADLVIDAILGTGATGAPRGDVADAIEAINHSGKRVLAVDIPSGVFGVDGTTPGPVVRADVTVAIQVLKPGHLLLPGALYGGRVDVADIGIATGDSQLGVPLGDDVRRVLPAIAPDAHKYSVGALGILAGSTGMTGAAVLTARGAIRAGVGLVMLGVPAATLETIEAAVVEAVKVPLPDIEGRLDAKSVDEFADRLERCRALAVGPGIGRGPQAVALVRRVLDVALPLVVDGDGLWALAEVLRDEPDALSARSHATVLTPHDGEFAYLTGEAPGSDRVGAVRQLADRLGAIVHLKGRRALTTTPDGTVWVNTTGNPGAATGGTGDVLTGVIGALIAQGAGAADATWSGAFVHGLAADAVAGRLGRRSLAARDLPEALPTAFRVVERTRRHAAAIRSVIEPMT